MNQPDFMLTEQCLFCQSSNITPYEQRIDHRWIVVCNSCNFAFLDQNNTSSTILQTSSYTANSEQLDIAADTTAGAAYQTTNYDPYIWAIALLDIVGASGSLLDIGCKDGSFLDLAKIYGCRNLTGVEPVGSAANLAQAKGYKIYNQTLPEANFEEGLHFDLITAWLSLGSMREPHLVLERIKQLLTPEGILFFEVPCLTFEQNDNYWLHNSLEQVSYFTVKSWRHIVETTFQQAYIGRVVHRPGAGATIIGFISPSKSKLDSLYKAGHYLNWITQPELDEINQASLPAYLVLFLRYLEDFETAKIIVEKLIHSSLEQEKLFTPYFSYVAQRYLEAYYSEQDHRAAAEFNLAQLAQRHTFEFQSHQRYLEGKSYFETQITTRDEEISNLNKVIAAKNQDITTYLEANGLLSNQLEQTEQSLQQLTNKFFIDHQKMEQLRQTITFQEHSLQAKEEIISTKNQDALIKNEALEYKDYQIWLRDVHIQNLTSSKLYRLKEALLTDPLTLYKLVRIVYLITSLVIPPPLKRPFYPVVDLVRQTLLNRSAHKHTVQDKTSPPVEIEIVQQQWDRTKPLISVIIPCYNYGQYIEEAIDSVLNQTFDNVEIIVIDDGSNEPYTIEILNKLHKPKTRIVRQANQGVVRARNNGIKIAQGKYICCLDADDLLHATYLEKCLIKLETENLDICYPWLKEFGSGDYIYQTGEFKIENLMQENCVLVCAVFKRSMWQRVGGFKATGYEDWEFWLSLAEAGGIGGRINEPLFFYRKHGYSRIDYLTERHNRNLDEIKKLHRRLYTKPHVLKKAVQQQNKQYRVRQPYLNLLPQPAQSKNGQHILFALPWTIVGGVDTLLVQLIEALKQNNINVTVVTTVPLSTEEASRMGDTRPWYEKFTQDIHPLPRFLPETSWKEYIFYLMQSRSIDLVYIVGSTYLYTILPDIKRCFPHIKVVDQLFNQVGHMENNRKYKGQIDLNITDNKLVEQTWLHKYREKAAKVSLIQTGVDINYFAPGSTVPYQLFSSYPFLKNKFIVSYFGRMSDEKWPELFIEIARQFKDAQNMHFLMCGNGPLFGKVKNLITEYELTERVFLTDFVSDHDFINLLGISNLTVLTSHIEGRPFIVMESQSMGIPVVAPKVGGLSWMIQDGVTGFLCEPGNIDHFVTAIQTARDNTPLYKQMRQLTRQYALNELDVEKMKDAYIQTFKGLLGVTSSNSLQLKDYTNPAAEEGEGEAVELVR